MRIVLAFLLVLLLVPGYSVEPRLPLLDAAHPVIVTRPVVLQIGNRARTRLGRLTFLGGLQLTSPDPAFGSFSSITVAGGRITLLSDAGNVVSFALRRGAVVAPRFLNLPGGPGTGWTKADRDSESMALDPASGRLWVGFERHNAIWRYAPGFARAERGVAPPAMRRWADNAGPESLVRLHDGRFLVLRESRKPHGALVFAGDPVTSPLAFRFSYRPPRGYVPSDAAELPDGDLLVLNRRFRLPYSFQVKLVRLRQRGVRAGAVVQGEELAHFAPPVVVDNFEGIAVTQHADGPHVWIVSDDNQSVLQRTLLLQFQLDR